MNLGESLVPSVSPAIALWSPPIKTEHQEIDDLFENVNDEIKMDGKSANCVDLPGFIHPNFSRPGSAPE